MRLRHHRPGFTLMEIAVSTAIVVMLAAATAPAFSGYLDEQRAQTAANTLSAIRLGIVNGTNQGFYNLVDSAAGFGDYPGYVSDLANQLVINVAADHNACGQTHHYVANDTIGWHNNGPFVNFSVPEVTGGAIAITLPFGNVLDSIAHTTITTSGSTTTFLKVTIYNVLDDDAFTLDAIMDGGDGAAKGSIRFSQPAIGGKDTVFFYIPVSSAHC